MYELQQGKSDAKIRDLAAKTGDKLPPKLVDRPTLHPGLDLYWKAFWECSTDRDIGMAEGPLPWSSIDRWAKRYGYEDDEFDRLVYLLKAMDSIYIEERTKQHEKKMKKGKGSIRKPSGSSAAIRAKSK